MRREGRPGEKGILTSRVIDRPIRPLFPGDFRNDVSIASIMTTFLPVETTVTSRSETSACSRVGLTTSLPSTP